MRAIPREVFDGFVRDVGHAYALGLWCADGYWWSSSIGISNVEPELVARFGRYLAGVFEPDRVRLRVYLARGAMIDERVASLASTVSVCPPSTKTKRTAYHLYVNSRPLLRQFAQERERLEEIPDEYLGGYFAGRFDGDGTFGTRFRIAYTTAREAVADAALLGKAGLARTSVLRYTKANESVVYVHSADREAFAALIAPYSWKASCRNTL